MTAEQAPDPAAALAAARRPLEPRSMPPADFAVRMRTSVVLRRLVPTRLAVRRAAKKGAALWDRSPEERDRARTTLEVIITGTARANELETLAQTYLGEGAIQTVLFWQPWRATRSDEQSLAHLRGALSGDRGVLLSHCHLGPYHPSTTVVAPLRPTAFRVVDPWLLAKPTPDYWGRRLVRWRRGLSAHGIRLVRSTGSFPVLRALLEQNEVVDLAFDVPGHHETRLLGKSAMLADGTARLAVQTRALVLPIRARRDGHRVWTDVSQPLDPHDFAGADELHGALAAVHERRILEAPSTLEDPRRPGAWEQGASANAWIRVEPGRAPSSESASTDGDTDPLLA